MLCDPVHLPIVASDEYTFLIGPELQFRSEKYDGGQALTWLDVDGDSEDLYQFVASKTVGAPTIAYFETAVLRAIYERKHGKSSEKVRDSELQKLMWKSVTLLSIRYPLDTNHA